MSSIGNSSSSSLTMWSVDQDDCMKALGVLSKVKLNDKIKIVNADKLEIDIEDGNRFSRTLRGDGCQSTVEIINKIMDNSLPFLKSAHAAISKFNRNNLSKKDEEVESKYIEMKALFAKALWGMSYLRDTYNSKDEGEYKFAKELNDKIKEQMKEILPLLEEHNKPRFPDTIDFIDKSKDQAEPSYVSSVFQYAVSTVSTGLSSIFAVK